MSFEEGPYVQVACICENIIEDKSGTFSLIRIIDTLTTSAMGGAAPREMPPLAAALKLVVMLKSGNAQGRSDVHIVPELPSAERQQEMVLSAQFQGEEQGVNLVVNLNFTFTLEGVHWFHVYIDDAKITSIPLRIRYQRMALGG
jgi:hypothetical protein